MKNRIFHQIPIPPLTDVSGLCTIIGKLIIARGGEDNGVLENDSEAMQRLVNHPIEESKQKLTNEIMKFDQNISQLSNLGKVTVVAAKTNDKLMTLTLDHEPELNFIDVNSKG